MSKPMRLTVLMPTYNEEGNIASMLIDLQSVLRKTNYQISYLIVDDNSRDKTQDIVNELIKKNPTIHLITGKKAGLGNALIRGYLYALKNLRPDFIITIDADFAVSPRIIPSMLKYLEHGSDVVVASRHVKGGKTVGWSYLRTVIHNLSTEIFAHAIAGVRSTCDVNSLTRAIRVRGVLDQIDFKNIKVRGHGFLYYLLYQLSHVTDKFKEIPSTFYPRSIGQSKLRASDVIEYIKISFQIRRERKSLAS